MLTWNLCIICIPILSNECNSLNYIHTPTFMIFLLHSQPSTQAPTFLSSTTTHLLHFSFIFRLFIIFSAKSITKIYNRRALKKLLGKTDSKLLITNIFLILGGVPFLDRFDYKNSQPISTVREASDKTNYKLLITTNY